MAQKGEGAGGISPPQMFSEVTAKIRISALLPINARSKISAPLPLRFFEISVPSRISPPLLPSFRQGTTVCK